MLHRTTSTLLLPLTLLLATATACGGESEPEKPLAKKIWGKWLKESHALATGGGKK